MQVNILSLGLMTFLGGCTMGNESFSTEPGTGFGWQSVSKNHEKIQENIKSEALQCAMKRSEKSQSFAKILTHQSHTTSYENIARTPDQFLRVWFAPSVDEAGNLHEARSVQTLLKAGQWSIHEDKVHEN